MNALTAETLDARLVRLNAIAVERRENPPHRRFVVERADGNVGTILGSGSTRRDAIQQAEHRCEVRS